MVLNPLSFKRVVRSWSARRTRSAFREALRERGFDAEGRKVAGDSDQNTEEADSLKGSLDIMIQPKGVRVDSGTIKTDIKYLLDILLQRGSTELDDHLENEDE